MQKISLSLLFLLSISFNLYGKQLYIWADFIEKKLFYFDRETETLTGRSIDAIRNTRGRSIGRVVYVSNYVVANYIYHTEDGLRGGYALLDVRDGSYREIESADLVAGHFSTFAVARDQSRKYLILGLINVENYEVTPASHEVDYFKWDPNSESSPIPISSDEYVNLIQGTIVSYNDTLALVSDISRSKVKRKLTNADCVFVYNGNMEVWSHEDRRFYVLRHVPDFEEKNVEYHLAQGQTRIRGSDRGFRRIHFISVDGFRSVRIVRF